uniref:Uncharacterized protein n=1 Tax=Arundo donax TaxID=35708 RepID=A0A0A8YM37_ARUDO
MLGGCFFSLLYSSGISNPLIVITLDFQTCGKFYGTCAYVGLSQDLCCSQLAIINVVLFCFLSTVCFHYITFKFFNMEAK